MQEEICKKDGKMCPYSNYFIEEQWQGSSYYRLPINKRSSSPWSY